MKLTTILRMKMTRPLRLKLTPDLVIIFLLMAIILSKLVVQTNLHRDGKQFNPHEQSKKYY
jgi:hypothetical protein